jgi:hypothetical protein
VGIMGENEKFKIKRLEAQMHNLYLDNQILKKTMSMILERLGYLEEQYKIVPDEDDIFESTPQVFPVQNKNKIVAEYNVMEVT